MKIKPITDKDSWTDAKKIINARICRAPYWSGESKILLTTEANAAVSVWWEEVIAYYCKPPVLDLFVEEVCKRINASKDAVSLVRLALVCTSSSQHLS